MNNNETALQGTRLPKIGSNGAVLLSPEYRDRIVNLLNALANLEVIIPQTDGSNVQDAKKARIDISELAMRITLPPATLPNSAAASTVPFSGSGGPTSSTLSASYSYVAGPTPSLYVDLTGYNLWVCTTAGSNSSSVWNQISGGGGSGGITGVQQFKIVSDGGDYWVCKSWDGTTLGSVTQNVAKPYKLRAGGSGPSGETIRGISYSYIYTGVAVGMVTGYYTRGVTGSDGSSETDYTIPDPLANDIIYAVPCTTTILSSSVMPLTILTATLAAAGSGYTAGTYPISGGAGTAATVTITVSGGAIATVTLASSGSYATLPTLINATFSGGGGSGGKVSLTAAQAMLDINNDARCWAH